MSAPVTTTAHQVATRAFDWLRRSETYGGLPADSTADLADPNSDYKPLAETALACSLILREGVAGPREARTARMLLDFAWQQLREGDLLYERQLRHTLMTDPLEVYAHFVRAGYRHRRLERLLEHLNGLRSRHAAEMMPNRRLAVANATRIAGFATEQEQDWDALTAGTWLGRAPEPWAIDWMTAYCLTHTVFHITDWGARPEALPPNLQSYLATWLPVWTDIWKEVAQWDLVTELLIVGACLEEPYCDPVVWAEIAAEQHPDGMLPRDADPVSGDPAEAFKTHQHTTVVAAVAGTLTLSRTLGAPAPAPATVRS
ncbi:DUF6895 family protein [Streptomyces sp. 7N604]|uniref:DUF6895 family protein n=1 Tax=Streptomyces sp. 7N604 TaxID=3457415 RepID=UPI003FD58C95